MRNASLIRGLWLLAGVLLISSAALAQVSVGVSIRIGPPALPVYEQPRVREMVLSGFPVTGHGGLKA